MEFYEAFADRYDALAWPDERRDRAESFFRDVFDRHGRDVTRVLDCSCGTGHHVALFEARLGLDAVGSDASGEMVDRATGLADDRGLAATFHVADFRHLTETFAEGSFDAVVCVGNSLPHLTDDADLRRAASEMRSVLRSEGILVVGQRNFDRLRAERRRFIPVTVTDEEAFLYVLDHHDGTITFNVVVLELAEVDLEVYATEYNALGRDRLLGILREAGFSVEATYGDGRSTFDADEDDRIRVVCRA